MSSTLTIPTWKLPTAFAGSGRLSLSGTDKELRTTTTHPHRAGVGGENILDLVELPLLPAAMQLLPKETPEHV